MDPRRIFQANPLKIIKLVDLIPTRQKRNPQVEIVKNLAKNISDPIAIDMGSGLTKAVKITKKTTLISSF